MLMKKVLIIIFVLTCLLGLVSCDPGTKTLDKVELLVNTVETELVYYENENPKDIYYRGKNTPIFDFSKVTPIATLDASHFVDVADELSRIEFLVFPQALNEPIGKALILYQNNGNMIVLFNGAYENKKGNSKHVGACSIFDETGMFIEHIGNCVPNCIDTFESKYFASNK